MITTESKQKRLSMAVMLGTFMASLDATIVAVALPTMAVDFSEAGSTTNVTWILLGYTLALCCLILLWGKLGNRIGYGKIFISGVAVFSIMSLIIGLLGTIVESSLMAIIILRVAQGAGAGMIMSMGLAIVNSSMPKETRGRSVGTITLMASMGTAIGPVFGGILCNFHWSYIFFINVPIGLLCLFLFFSSSSTIIDTQKKSEKLDVIGTILMVVMMFSLIYFLNQGNSNGWTSETSIVLVMVGLIVAGLLAWWEQRVSDPVIPMRLMAIGDVVKENLTALLVFAGMAGTYLLMPYYLEMCLGYDTINMGLILIANSIGMMAVGPLVGKISDRTGNNRRMVSVGCLISAVGFIMMAMLTVDSPLWYILLSLFVMGAGAGMTLVAATNLCLGYSNESESGEASGLINTFRQAGSTAGVAILESIFAASITLSAITDASDMMIGFRHAFFVAMLLSMVAFVISMFVKDYSQKKVEQDNI